MQAEEPERPMGRAQTMDEATRRGFVLWLTGYGVLAVLLGALHAAGLIALH